MENIVYIREINEYDENEIYKALENSLFEPIITAKKVVIKPNWVREAHIERPGHWDYVITHPQIISAVLRKVIEMLPPGGRVSIMDGPEFSSSFEKIMSYYPVALWKQQASLKDIEIEIIDLRDEIWIDNGNVVIKREKNAGDPRGSTQINLLGNLSEFNDHSKSKKGYFGADSNIDETNKAHDGVNNLYRVSTTALECDVFINLPKLKTHKKAGITSCLKNLVGINTYRNYLPHYSIGTKENKGDQFYLSGTKQKIEGRLMPLIHQYIRTNTFLSKGLSPFMSIGKFFFGNNKQTIRSGSWYGNDTIWRMILDINKVLLYADASGEIRQDNSESRKKYIGIVDGILCGEGNGPKIPDPKKLNYLVQGSNPAVIDAVCSEVMGFDNSKIPSIKHAFLIKKLKITHFSYDEIFVIFDENKYNINEVPFSKKKKFTAANGWINNIEK